MPKRRKPKTLPAVHPNAGVEAEFRRKLLRLVDAMAASVSFWLRASYRKNQPAIAMDEPADNLSRSMKRLRKRWEKNFDDAAKDLAKYFAKSAEKRSDAALRSILRRGGFAVRLQMTPAMRDIASATVHENVSLIRSIPQQYLSDVEGMVMRSVQRGGDLKQLTDDLRKRHGITRRRAANIARDQNNKATGAFHRARQIELGVTTAVWKHSHAGRRPRPTHVANDGKSYDVKKGWYDPAVRRHIHPGELINCRCTSKSVIPGF